MYSEALIERVAAGIYESRSSVEPEYEPGTWPPVHADDVQTMRDFAVAALNALGLREENGTHWSGAPLIRYVTEWEDA